MKEFANFYETVVEDRRKKTETATQQFRVVKLFHNLFPTRMEEVTEDGFAGHILTAFLGSVGKDIEQRFDKLKDDR